MISVFFQVLVKKGVDAISEGIDVFLSQIVGKFHYRMAVEGRFCQKSQKQTTTVRYYLLSNQRNRPSK